MTFSSSPVVSELTSELRVGRPGFYSWLGQSVVPLRLAGRKMRVSLLGLAKSIYYDFSRAIWDK